MAREVKKPAKQRLPRKRALRHAAQGEPGDVSSVGKRVIPTEPAAVPLAIRPGSAVLDRIFAVVTERRDADPAVSHSARLLARGRTKIAQKFGEEAVECLIEAVAGNRDALIAESADVLYHLIVVWVDAGIGVEEIWAELKRREGISGVAEKASRARALPVAFGLDTTKTP
ncbi:MAG: phosphoribosyl-ATP diphosphatase [Alphaproteobacteria bacterium]|nr:phosphoribosyl-ATP diphosphatase [Alphaproteobacteria bacterium]